PMEACRAHRPMPACLVIGDSELLSAEVSRRLRATGVHFLAPLPRSSELDVEFLSLPAGGWQELAYVAQRQEKLPPQERTQYLGQEVAWEWTDPQTGALERFRRLYVISSEERATRRKVRGQQLAKAATELEQVAGRLGKGKRK